MYSIRVPTKAKPNPKRQNPEPQFVPVSVTLPPDLVTKIDMRAAELDLTRSQYFRSIARRDLDRSRPAAVAA